MAEDADTVILFPKSYTLVELAEEVSTHEQLLGPVIAMGRTDEKSAITFQLDRRPQAELKLAQAKPPNATEVCKGQVWSANARVDAVAYRL